MDKIKKLKQKLLYNYPNIIVRLIKTKDDIISKRQARIERRSPYKKAVYRWEKVQGDEYFRYCYNLNENSLVFDLGGYVGEYTDKIFSKFKCNVYVFEPVKEFCDVIREKFEENDKIHIFQFGLESIDSEDKIQLIEDGSSTYFENGDNSKIEKIYFESAKKFICENGITNIDVMKINIEGGEYDLLEHLIETGLISLIDNLQIQFHEITAINSEYRMKKLQQNLKRTHRVTWKFRPYVWENWKRR